MLCSSGVDFYLIIVLKEIFCLLDLMHKLAKLVFNGVVIHNTQNTKENWAPMQTQNTLACLAHLANLVTIRVMAFPLYGFNKDGHC